MLVSYSTIARRRRYFLCYSARACGPACGYFLCYSARACGPACGYFLCYSARACGPACGLCYSARAYGYFLPVAGFVLTLAFLSPECPWNVRVGANSPSL